MRAVVALLVLLAGREGELEARVVRVRCGRRARAADGARRLAGEEAVPVHAVGLQAAHLDVHAVGEGGIGRDLATLHDVATVFVARDLPAYADRLGRHASAVERIGREAGPQDDAVGARTARSDAQRERIALKALGGDELRRPRHEHAGSSERPGGRQQPAPIHRCPGVLSHWPMLAAPRLSGHRPLALGRTVGVDAGCAR